MSNWSERARQMMADIPEVGTEFRTAIREHSVALKGTDQIAILTTWRRVVQSATRFVRINTEISDLVIEYYEHSESEK